MLGEAAEEITASNDSGEDNELSILRDLSIGELRQEGDDSLSEELIEIVLSEEQNNNASAIQDFPADCHDIEGSYNSAFYTQAATSVNIENDGDISAEILAATFSLANQSVEEFFNCSEEDEAQSAAEEENIVIVSQSTNSLHLNPNLREEGRDLNDVVSATATEQVEVKLVLTSKGEKRTSYTINRSAEAVPTWYERAEGSRYNQRAASDTEAHPATELEDSVPIQTAEETEDISNDSSSALEGWEYVPLNVEASADTDSIYSNFTLEPYDPSRRMCPDWEKCIIS